jgi:tetratricopeptide (TPR) repeat protein
MDAALLAPPSSFADRCQQQTRFQIAAALANVLIELAEIRLVRGDYAATAAIARRLTKIGQSAGLDYPRTAGHLLYGKAYKEHGRLAKARSRLAIALTLAQRTGIPRLEAEALYNLGGVAIAQGEKTRGHVWLEQALALYRRFGDRLEEANALCALSQIHYSDPCKVYQFTTQRLALAQRVGSAEDEFRALHRLAILWLNTGEYVRARDCCQQAVDLAQRLNSPRYAALVLDFLALAHHHLGDNLTALRYLEQTLQLCEEAGDQRGLAYALHWKGQVLLARGELANAADCYARAMDIRLAYGQAHLACQSQAGLARVCQAQGQATKARALVEPVVAKLDELRRIDIEDPCMLWLNCYLVLQAQHDRRAVAVLDQAYAIVQERASRISDAAMRHTFLHNVVVHSQIIAAWHERQASQVRAVTDIIKPNRGNNGVVGESSDAAGIAYALPVASMAQFPAFG